MSATDVLERAFAYGNSLAKKYGFTEEDLIPRTRSTGGIYA